MIKQAIVGLVAGLTVASGAVSAEAVRPVQQTAGTTAIVQTTTIQGGCARYPACPFTATAPSTTTAPSTLVPTAIEGGAAGGQGQDPQPPSQDPQPPSIGSLSPEASGMWLVGGLAGVALFIVGAGALLRRRSRDAA